MIRLVVLVALIQFSFYISPFNTFDYRKIGRQLGAFFLAAVKKSPTHSNVEDFASLIVPNKYKKYCVRDDSEKGIIFHVNQTCNVDEITHSIVDSCLKQRINTSSLLSHQSMYNYINLHQGDPFIFSNDNSSLSHIALPAATNTLFHVFIKKEYQPTRDLFLYYYITFKFFEPVECPSRLRDYLSDGRNAKDAQTSAAIK